MGTIRPKYGHNADSSETQLQFFGQVGFGYKVEPAHLSAPLLEHARFRGGFTTRAFAAEIDDGLGCWQVLSDSGADVRTEGRDLGDVASACFLEECGGLMFRPIDVIPRQDHITPPQIVIKTDDAIPGQDALHPQLFGRPERGARIGAIGAAKIRQYPDARLVRRYPQSKGPDLAVGRVYRAFFDEWPQSL